jgi:hypothetical protein
MEEYENSRETSRDDQGGEEWGAVEEEVVSRERPPARGRPRMMS